MRGKLLAVEGLDGCGKATQTRLLCQALEKRGFAVRSVSFPNYESDSSAPVRMYLSGVFGNKPGDVNAYAASVFYAVDRYASFRQDWQRFYEDGGIVVADRYTTANAVHQCSKLPEAAWDGFLDWLFDLEYRKMGLPAPEAVFFLDMQPAISQRLLSGRYHGEEGKKDIHEKDAAYLARSRAAAGYCAQKLGWRRIACDDGADALPVQAIHDSLLAQTLPLLED